MTIQNHANGLCPACGAPFPEIEPTADYYRSWRIVGGDDDCELACSQCGWEFAVDPNGAIVDDGGLDDSSPAEAEADDNEIDTDAAGLCRCPRCSRQFEPMPDCTQTCPWCKVQFYWADEPPILLHDEDGLEYEEWYGCPNCGNDGDMEGQMTSLGSDWLICQECRLLFHLDANDDSCSEQRRDNICVTLMPELVAYKQLNHMNYSMPRSIDARLMPGPYAGFTLDAPRVRIQSADGAEPARITQQVRFFGSRVVLTRLTMCDGVSFQQCEVTLRECNITGQVEAISCKLSMHGCRVTNAKGYGVALYQGSVLRMAQCQIQDCQDVSLLVESGSAARVLDSRFLNGQCDGIRVRPANRLAAHRCEVSGHGGCGIRIQQAHAVIRDTMVSRNRRCGLEVDPRSRVCLLRTRLENNEDTDLDRRRPTLLARKGCVIASMRGSGKQAPRS